MIVTKKYLKKKFPGNHAMHEVIDYIKPGRVGAKWHHVTNALTPGETLGGSGDFALVTFAGKIYIFNKVINYGTGVVEWELVADLTIEPITEFLQGDINGVNTLFTTSKPYASGKITVLLNGLKEYYFSELNETTIQMDSPPKNAGFKDILECIYTKKNNI